MALTINSEWEMKEAESTGGGRTRQGSIRWLIFNSTTHEKNDDMNQVRAIALI
jgi:hypothetical protein